MYLFLVGSSHTEHRSVQDVRGKNLLKVFKSQFCIGSLRNMRDLSSKIPNFLGEIRAGYSPVVAGIA
jgi:hypothetical protein